MKNRKLKSQVGNISLPMRDCGKMPGGVFPESQESFTDLAAGRIRKPYFEHCRDCYRKRRFEQINRIFWFFGYLVDLLDRMTMIMERFGMCGAESLHLKKYENMKKEKS